MALSQIPEILIIDMLSLHPKSDFPEEKRKALPWKKDDDGESYLEFSHNDEVLSAGDLEVDETQTGFQIRDIDDIIERSFKLVLEKIDAIFKTQPEAKEPDAKTVEILTNMGNWEMIIQQDYDESGESMLKTYWRLIRQETNAIPKIELKKIGTPVTKAFIEKTAHQVDFILKKSQPIEEPQVGEIAEQEIVPTQGIELTQETQVAKIKKPKVVKAVLKKDTKKYALGEIMKAHTPLTKTTFEGDEQAYKTHIAEAAKSLFTGEFEEILKTRGPNYQSDMERDSISWIDRVPMDKRLALIEQMLPKYREFLSLYPTNSELTPRDVLINTHGLGWDVSSFEYFVIRTYMAADRYADAIHFFEDMKGANSKTARTRITHPDVDTYDIWSTTAKFTDRIIFTHLTSEQKGDPYRKDKKDLIKEYMLRSFVEQMEIYAGTYAHLTYEDRYNYIRDYYNIGNKQAYQRILANTDTGAQHLQSLMLTFVSIYKLFGKGDYIRIREALATYLAVGMDEEQTKAIRFYLARDQFFKTFSGSVLMMKIPK